MVTAIDAFNRTDATYREETFCILALNAWELLLKAKLLKEAANNLGVLYRRERRILKNGKNSNKLFTHKTRSGNPQTLSIGQCIAALQRDHAVHLHDAVRKNLDALTEIRDNAVHFINAGAMLRKRVIEIGSASIRNYIELNAAWFDSQLANHDLYIMPIGFVHPQRPVIGVSAGAAESKLLSYLDELISSEPGDGSGLHAALEIHVSMTRSTSSDHKVQITSDPNAPRVQLSEQDIRQRYPWDYQTLTTRLYQRYEDFVANQKYHQLRRALKENSAYASVRYLDPGNPKSQRKDYFSPNIVQGFDLHYTRKPR